MDGPSSAGTGGLVIGVLTAFLSIVGFGLVAAKLVSPDRQVAQVAPADKPPAPAAKGEQPGVPPAAVKQDGKQAEPSVTAPASKQPVNPVNPGATGKMPDAESKTTTKPPPR